MCETPSPTFFVFTSCRPGFGSCLCLRNASLWHLFTNTHDVGPSGARVIAEPVSKVHGGGACNFLEGSFLSLLLFCVVAPHPPAFTLP